MSLQVFVKQAPLLHFVNLQTNESVSVQFNPGKIKIGSPVKWKEFIVPGMSHQPLHYLYTGNVHMQFKLRFIAHAEDGDTGIKKNLDTMYYLESLKYPKRGATTITDAGPPRVLVVWPNFLSLTCVIKKLDHEITRFNLDGIPIDFESKLDIMAIRDMRLTGEDVRRNGFTQSPGTSSSNSSSSGSNPSPPTGGDPGFRPGRSPSNI